MDEALGFIIEIDKLKSVLRKTKTMSGGRLENAAEHSWQIALMAMVFEQYSIEPINLPRVIEMLLIHDLVEIDAGDTFVYDEPARAVVFDAERASAERIFGILPEQAGSRFMELWLEFEGQETAEARFASAMDRLQPVISNLETEGFTWRENGIGLDQVLKRNGFAKDVVPELWSKLEPRLYEAQERGWLT